MCKPLSSSILSAPTNGKHLDRSANDENQITNIGSATLAYDSNGNITKDDHGDTLAYDAWNRLVAVYNASGVLLAGYTYDGYGRMTSETNVTTTTDFYYSGTQDIEERTGVTTYTGASLSSNGSTTLVNVYSPDYVNDILLRDSGGTRLYFSHDLTYNVTGVISTAGAVLQRQVYNAYGDVTFLTPSWGSSSDSYTLEHLWQGGWRSTLTSNYHFNARWYSPSLQWFSWDLANYPDGLSGYVPIADNPINREDPMGLKAIPTEHVAGRMVWLGPWEKAGPTVPGTIISQDGTGMAEVKLKQYYIRPYKELFKEEACGGPNPTIHWGKLAWAIGSAESQSPADNVTCLVFSVSLVLPLPYSKTIPVPGTSVRLGWYWGPAGAPPWNDAPPAPDGGTVTYTRYEDQLLPGETLVAHINDPAGFWAEPPPPTFP